MKEGKVKKMASERIDGKSALAVGRLDVEGRSWPLGIDCVRPMFHYTAVGGQNGKSVSACQVVVKSGRKVFWDSGKRPVLEFPYIAYEGEWLLPKTEYWVSMRLWDEQDVPGEFCAEVMFETGLMEEGFAADWMEPVQEDAIEEADIPYFFAFKSLPGHFGGDVRCRPAQNLRKIFTLSKKVERARVYMSAHGVYELFLNGKKVSDCFLAPEISAYQKMLYYQTYDVTKYLKFEENVLAVTVADGWWIGRIGLLGASCQYGNRLGIILQLEITYEDGGKDVICSDGSFECRESEIRYSDLYIGEKCDKTMETQIWRSCLPVNYSKENLVAQPTDGIVEYERLAPERWLVTPTGELVVDFGQVLAGVIHIAVNARKKQEIVFEYSETLDENGNFFRNIIGRNKDQKDVLICKEGKNDWQPRFTYHGFRYVKITGIDKEHVEWLEAICYGSKLERTGYFACSDERLNRLQSCILWSQQTNMISIPTDCPQREKMGWTGDIQIFTKTGAFNFDLRSFLNAWLANLRMEQKVDGAVPVVVPNFPKQEWMQRQIGEGSINSSGWSDACVLVPWYLYQCYGDIEVLRENLHCMQCYLEYVRSEAAKDSETREMFEKQVETREVWQSRNPYLWNAGYHYGDWLIPSLQRLPDGINQGREKTRAVVGSCWYAVIVETYLHVCQALNRDGICDLEQEIEDATRLLERIRDAIREEYVEEDGTVDSSDLQGVYVMVLRAGAVRGGLRKKVVSKLVSIIHADGDCLNTGFSSVGFLLDVLAQNGEKQLAYKLLYQTKNPSWLYMVENGATTIWENWEAVRPDGSVMECSLNHYAYGCVGDWIYRTIGGIRAEGSGYKEIIFEPDPECGVTSCQCALETPFGRAACHWKMEDGKMHVSLEVPVGSTGELWVRGEKVQMGAGKWQYTF